jgi:phosphoglycolate phosphatase/putative hydrolase of the HAD superfamily
MKTFALGARWGGIIFDMDGTLYSHPAYLDSQIELPLRRLAALQQKSYEDMKAEFDGYRENWAREHGGKKISMGNTFKVYGISIKENAAWREELYQPEQYLRPDARLRETLRLLTAEYRLSVVTNNPVSIAGRTLRCLGVEDVYALPEILLGGR